MFNFILLYVTIQFFPTPSVENTFPFPTVYSWSPVEGQLPLYGWVYFSALDKISEYCVFTRVIASNNSLRNWEEGWDVIWPTLYEKKLCNFKDRDSGS